jgi:hypothetical protein
MRTKIKALGISVVLVLLSSCQTTGVFLRETPLSISETRRAVVAVVGEPRSMSQNGREIISQYYDKKSRNIEKMDIARERLYTRVTILGDRRPYDIQVEVFIENRDSGGDFIRFDQDNSRAKVIAEKIEKALHQSRDSRNVIDDFRSF